MALREFLEILERSGELHRTDVEIDPALELTEICIRAQREGKPALLVTRPKNSTIPLVINHFASERRIELALGRPPERIGEEIIGFLERTIPLKLRFLWENRRTVGRLLSSRTARIPSGLSQEMNRMPDLDALPVQVCWPGDGGRFITYGQVITHDPQTGRRNIGVYRMHVFDKTTTGMHWQIQKGGGFHYHRSELLGRDLEVAVAIGTDPALLFAAIAALPEGIDEAMFAGFLQNKRVQFTKGKTVSIPVPASAEFILEGVVPVKERRMEGPFGDHFGHYSAASEFPVFHLRSITSRRDPIYPATVVGKPPMEDRFLGDATQKILSPLAKLIHKEVSGLWAYYEAGFHNLLSVAIEQRYQKEAMKAALGLMGTDQLSLSKCMVMVSSGVDVRDWHAVLREIRENFDPHYDFIMIPKVPLDTLDFTSYSMNLGSKMIIDATKKNLREPAQKRPGQNILTEIAAIRTLDNRILDVNCVDGSLAVIKVSSGGREIVEKLVRDPRLSGLPIVAAVSDDVDIHSKESYIWGIFTRFDCERDVIFTEQNLRGIAPVYKGILGIDATWKPGYPGPLLMDKMVAQRVDEKWGRIWK